MKRCVLVLLAGCAAGPEVTADPPAPPQVVAAGSVSVVPTLAAAALAISPSSEDLGAMAAGQASAPFAFVVSNPGGTQTGVLAAHAAGDFAITGDGCSHDLLPAGGHCTILVELRPTSVGACTGTLAVTAEGDAASAALGGIGLAPSQLQIAPASFDFGTIDAGTTATQDFAITNQGGVASDALGAASITVFGIAADDCFGRSLAPGASCVVTVRFSPPVFGTQHATLSVGDAVASLAGTGRDTVALAIAVAGAGSVTVAGAPTLSGQAIACPESSCGDSFARAATAPTLTLTAHPVPGSHFAGWTGAACATASCIVTLSTPLSIAATFDVDLAHLAIATAGTGTVTTDPAGSVFPVGTVVTLTASGPVLRWTGACAGSAMTCTIALGGDTTVGVAFPDCRAAPVADASTAALWHLDEGSGQILHDASGHGRDATLGKDDKVADDDPVWAAGRFGGGLYFDASNCPYVANEHCEWMHAVTDPIDFATGFSLELWLDATGVLGSKPTYQDDDGDGPRYANLVTTESPSVWMTMTAATELEAQPADINGHGPEVLVGGIALANGWHAIALTYDGATARLYIDGALAVQSSAPIAQAQATSFDIGGTPMGAFLNGYLDEIRVSQTARSSAEIARAYAAAAICPQ